MKRVISLILSVAILLCCICFSGCNSKKEPTTSEEVLEQLKREGFSNAYIDASNNRKIFVDNDTFIIIISPSDGSNFFQICELNKDSDIESILNAFEVFFNDNVSTYGDGYIFAKIQEEVKNIQESSTGITNSSIFEDGYACDIFMDNTITYIESICLRER